MWFCSWLSALTCCVTLSQTLTLSGSQFPQVYKEDWMTLCCSPRHPPPVLSLLFSLRYPRHCVVPLGP